jgi:hypothetical protein
VSLIGLGLALTIADLRTPPTAAPRVSVAYAATQVEPYTFLEAGMFQVSSLPASEAERLGAWEVADLTGMMATDLVRTGDLLSTGNALPVEAYREWADMSMELVSFGAATDQLVAGQIKPGQLINIYGYHAGNPADAYTLLVEPNVRVVAARQGSGELSGAGTAVPNWDTGAADYSGERVRPGTLITVALPPEKAYHLVDSLGAKGLTPYVTLAANRTAVVATAPPVTPTVVKAATPPDDPWGTLVAPPPMPTVGLGPTGGGWDGDDARP